MEHNHVMDSFFNHAYVKEAGHFISPITAKVGSLFTRLVRKIDHSQLTNLRTVKVLGVLGLISSLSYLFPAVLHKLIHFEQDLKKKYKAKWALVTGGSSGIGLALVEKLAQQGLNVVVVAFPDSTFTKNQEMLKRMHPLVDFIFVEVDLSLPNSAYLPIIERACEKLDVQLLFNNAGYIKTGFFTDTLLVDQQKNHTCNATSAMELTHVFVKKMVEKKLKGCVGFTSSPAGFMPCPFTAMYGSTKAYLTEFATSIAPELKPDGIDVLVVHPSPVATRFYEGTHSIGALEFFKGTATGPEKIAQVFFESMGRTVIRDQGYYPPMVKLILKVLDYNLLADIICSSAKMLPDFTKLRGAKPASERAL
jgi:short-subunit dehydrogenase